MPELVCNCARTRIHRHHMGPSIFGDERCPVHGDTESGPACDTCKGQGVVPAPGPDENGQYDTDDCPDCVEADHA